MNQAFQNIIADRGWDDPSGDDIDLCGIMQNIENRLARRLPKGVELTLTTFQKKVIGDPQFWRDWSDEEYCAHLMVQGATSAGKTLVSELNILDTLRNGQKAVVLVPLKAMVHERTEQFREDMPHLNVCGSSSDHMENDERIIGGEFDVAVIVYEKFFSMLSQSSAKVMERCGLLVVDELSMLSKEQRGPKLEMILEIVRTRHPDTRIMCLATCDCSTAKICQWLDIEEPIISTARPVPLEEHIVNLDGTGFYRKIPADYEQNQEEPEKIEEQLTIPGYRSDWRLVQKRNELLRVVLRRVCESMHNARILIFLAYKSAAERVAEYLAESMSDLFPQLSRNDEEYRDFMLRVGACDRDEDQDKLIETLLPRGIAYHHAGLSTTLREVIEGEFQRPNSSIKVIVATETLTIGVNMPFDAMIMVTNTVPRGQGQESRLTRQEYRNYIGRAGRLGQNNRTGVTYLFVDNREDLRYYWNSFYAQEEVSSALTKATERDLAPYYLSLLTSGSNSPTFTAGQLQELFDTSLSKTCSPRKKFNPQKLYDHLYDGYLASDSPQAMGAKGARKPGLPIYAVNSFGKHIAPYALSVDTCIDIFYYFYEGYKNGGLPAEITQEDIESDRYLLEMLYHICRHAEIAGSSILTFPDDDHRPEKAFKAKKLVLKRLQALLSETDEDGKPRNELWCQGLPEEEQEKNELWLLSKRTNLVDETAMLQAALRAILLLYWTKGKTLAEIRSITEFRGITNLNGGDIERMAELVSFHLDAIHKCLRSAVSSDVQVYASPEAASAFYALQTRVKYGMPRDLVQFANKHIYGLDRSRLLALRRDAVRMELTPVQYLYTAPADRLGKHLSMTHRTQLLQAMERRSSVREFDTLMEIVSKDAGTKLTSENDACLRAIADWDGQDPEDLYDQLKELLKNDAFKSTRLGMDGNVHCIRWTLKDRELCIGLLEKDTSERTLARIRRFFEENSPAPRILLIPGRNANDGWDTLDIGSKARYFDCTAVLNTTFLAMILANTIRIDLGGGEEMFEFLEDARGFYTKADYKFFSLSNYIRHTSQAAAAPKFRLLCSNDMGSSISDLKIQLSKTKDLQNYEILPMGSQLSARNYDFSQCPTIVLLSREQITRSRSLTNFMVTMRNQNFQNCLLLLESQAAERTWDSREELESFPCNKWQPQLNKIRRKVFSDSTEAVSAIRTFLAGWKREDFLIGISYAHYDARALGDHSDLALIRKLADRLREEYGEHRILFDQFAPAKDLFVERGSERSLAAYAKCKIGILLWNCWTAENVNCIEEHKVISRACEAGTAKRIYLQSGQRDDPDVPEPYFSVYLSDTEDIARNIRKLLRELGENI